MKLKVFIPILLACLPFFCSAQRFSNKGNTVNYRNDKFVLSSKPNDTGYVTDPATGQEYMKVVMHDTYPLKMNGVTVFYEPDVKPNLKQDNKPIFYLAKCLKKELGKLPDGHFSLSIRNLVIDTQGSVRYLFYEGPNNNTKISSNIQQNILDALKKLLLNTVFEPGMKDGKKVISIEQGDWLDFKILDHRLYINQYKGDYDLVE